MVRMGQAITVKGALIMVKVVLILVTQMPRMVKVALDHMGKVDLDHMGKVDLDLAKVDPMDKVVQMDPMGRVAQEWVVVQEWVVQEWVAQEWVVQVWVVQVWVVQVWVVQVWVVLAMEGLTDILASEMAMQTLKK